MTVLEKNDLWIADPTDANYPNAPTTRLIDLNVGEGPDAENCAPGFFLWSNPSFGQDALTSVDLSSYGTDGSRRAGKGRDDRVLNFTLGYRLDPTLSDQEAMELAMADLGALGEALDTEGVLAWQLKWLAQPVYFDFKDSPIPELLRGGADSLPLLLKAKAAPDGLPIELTVHPWPRWTTREIPGGTVNMGEGARHLILTNPGNRPSEFRMEADVNGGSVAGFHIAFRTEGDLAEWAQKYSSSADNWTSKIADCSIASDVATISFATEDNMAWRFRDPITLVNPTAMEGVHQLTYRLRLGDGSVSPSEFKIQARVGFSGDDYPQESLVVIPLNARDIDTPDYVEIKMGPITVPKGTKRIDIDFYASREAGDGSLKVQLRNLIPASVWNFGAFTPGLFEGDWGEERFDAEDLAGTGEMKRKRYRLNALDEYARARPGTGTTGGGKLWPAGVHSLEVFGSAREPTEDETDVGTLEAVVASSGVVRKSIKLRTKEGRVFTYFKKKPHKRRRFFFTVTSADYSGGVKFFPRVKQTAATLAGRRIEIDHIIHSFIRAATADTPMVLDTFQRRAFVMNAIENTLFPLVPTNEWPLMPPGQFAIHVSVFDIPPDPGYDDFDTREPTPKSTLSRSTVLTFDVWPRRIGMG